MHENEGSHLDQDSHSAEVFDHSIGEMLLTGRKINEGGKAVIVEIDPDRLSPESHTTFDALTDSAETKRQKTAVKLFKLYLPNKGRNEYTIHTKVYEALQNIPENEKDQYASVPQPLSAHDTTLDKETRAKLEARFSIPSLGEKVFLMPMEEIEGEDLATIFYKWILERQGIPAEHTDDMDFKQLYEEVAERLHFEDIPLNDIDAPQKDLDDLEKTIAVRNANILYAYLHKYNFPLPPEVASSIQKTLELMHENKMTHGDAFERNIMVTGGTKALREKGSLQGERSVLIDFGESREGVIEGVNDFDVIRRLKTLSISREDERKERDAKKLGEITAKAELLRGNKQWQKIYETAKGFLQPQAGSSMRDEGKALLYAWNSTVPYKETGAEDFVAIAKDLMDENLLTRETVNAFIEEQAKGKMAIPAKALLMKCVEWLNLS